MIMRFLRLALLVLSFSICGNLLSQGLSPNVVMIPTSHGDSLEADVYLPNTTDSFPTILIQTPYSKMPFRFWLPLGIGLDLASSDYAIVVLDWRGRFANFLKADASRPLGEDGYDVVEWIAAQTWSDGNIGTWGPSALGNIQFQTAKEKPPHLVCAVPVVASPHVDYNHYFQGGAAKVEFLEAGDALGFSFSAVMAQPYQGLAWDIARNNTVYPSDIEIPMLMIGGWFDHNTDATIFQFDTCSALSPLPLGTKHHMLLGPWVHGGNGTATVGSRNQGDLEFPDAEWENDADAIAFFDYHLRGVSNGWDTTSAVKYFQMGEDVWKKSSSWPPSTTPQRWYLRSDQSLAGGMEAAESSLAYDYDPEDPSPTIGGATLSPGVKQGPFDQDSVLMRSDHLTYTSPILADPLQIMGSPKLKLFVESDRLDTDFTVRFCLLDALGRSILLNENTQRMRFREGYRIADTSFMKMGETYAIDIELPPLAITFQPGDQFQIIISSSNYPKHNRNMNNGEFDMYPLNNPDSVFNPLVAHNSVWTGGSKSSYIELPQKNLVNALDLSQNGDAGIEVFPNPAEDWIGLLGFEDQVVEIFNVFGQKVLEASKGRIEITDLSSGLYFVRIVGEEDEILSIPFVKR